MSIPIPSPTPSTHFYFPVTLAPIYTVVEGQQRVDSTYSAIVRTDHSRVLGICRTGSYHLLSNEEAYTGLEDALRESALDLEGMQVQDAISHYGGLCVRTYTFPAHSRSVARVGDIVSLRLQCVNSFNLASSFIIHINALRLACTNGMVMPTKALTRITLRHSRRLDIPAMGRGLGETLSVFEEQAHQWRQWAAIRITDAEVDRLLHALPHLNPKLEERLRTQFVRESEDLGNSLYAFFTALTHYATHAEVKASAQANQAGVVLQRENRIRAVLNSPTWRQLAKV